MTETPTFARREAITLAGAVAAVSAAPLRAAARSLPLDTPEQRLRTFMLMRGALDDRLVIGYLEGFYYGVVNGVAKPLFRLVSATFSRYRRKGDGYECVTLEQAYFLDWTTGEWIHRFANPYTGRTVDVPTGGYPAGRVFFAPNLELTFPGAPSGQQLKHSTTPFTIAGDDLYITETIDGAVAPRGGGAPLEYHEVTGLHARVSELAAPGVKKVRTETSYTSTKGWRPWLDMAGHPGETVSMGQGIYGAALGGLPTSWITAARQHRPDLLADPIKILDPVWRA